MILSPGAAVWRDHEARSSPSADSPNPSVQQSHPNRERTNMVSGIIGLLPLAPRGKGRASLGLRKLNTSGVVMALKFLTL